MDDKWKIRLLKAFFRLLYPDVVLPIVSVLFVLGLIFIGPHC